MVCPGSTGFPPFFQLNYPFGGDPTMQMYDNFEGFPWFPLVTGALFGLVLTNQYIEKSYTVAKESMAQPPKRWRFVFGAMIHQDIDFPGGRSFVFVVQLLSHSSQGGTEHLFVAGVVMESFDPVAKHMQVPGKTPPWWTWWWGGLG